MDAPVVFYLYYLTGVAEQQLCVLICLLYYLIHNLTSKELTEYSEWIVLIKHRRQIWGAIVVEIVNMQRLKIRQLPWLGWFYSNPRPSKTDSAPVRGDGYEPESVQTQSQRRDVAQRAIRLSGGGGYYGQ